MKFLAPHSLSNEIKQMLSVTDNNCLVLAYGYFDGRQVQDVELWNWLNRSDDRHLVLIAGIHGKLNYSPYLAATDGDGRASTMTEMPENELQDIVNSFKQVFNKFVCGPEMVEQVYPTLPDMPHPRVHVLVSEHFHAKLAMTAQVNTPFSLFSSKAVRWQPTSAILGSSNFTFAAQQQNIELDLHLDAQDTAALQALKSASQGIVQEAIDRAETSESVSENATRRVIDAITNLLDDNEYDRNQNSARRKKREHDQMRKDADAELE
jgi:hypothetical protein